jgi:hypothetical protein
MQLTINCINGRKENYSELTLKCSYRELLSALYRAYKSFSRILYDNGMNKNRFEATYNYSIESIKKLKKEIEMLNDSG